MKSDDASLATLSGDNQSLDIYHIGMYYTFNNYMDRNIKVFVIRFRASISLK